MMSPPFFVAESGVCMPLDPGTLAKRAESRANLKSN